MASFARPALPQRAWTIEEHALFAARREFELLMLPLPFSLGQGSILCFLGIKEGLQLDPEAESRRGECSLVAGEHGIQNRFENG